MKSILQVSILILCVLLSSNASYFWYKFFPKGRKFATAYNKEREKRGIPILPEDWVTRDNAANTKAWFPADTNHGITYRSMKLTRIDEGNLVYEKDHIVHEGPNYREVLIMGYNYDSTNHWKCSYSTWKPGDKELLLSKEQADSVLSSWNFTIAQINNSKK